MESLILILVLGLAAIVSILLDRRWQRRAAQQTTLPQPVHVPSATFTEQIKVGWYKRMGWRTQPAAESSKLRDWLVTHLAEQSPVQRWVAGLTEADFSALYQSLQAFCTSLQIDLAWLGEQSLTKDPALQTTVESVVLHYVQAQQQAMGIQAELQAFKSYLALEQRPYSYEHQPLIQQLYTHLVKAELTASVRPEALLASEKIRVEHMLRAIQAAADRDRPAFYRIVNALRNPSQPVEAAAPAPASGNSQPAPATVS